MGCERFETEGLLYTSGELETGAAQEYAAHVVDCTDCRDELASAASLHDMVDGGRAFEVDTPPAMDAIILKLCSCPVRPAVGSLFGFGTAVRRFALPVLFLAVGFGGGAYLSVVAMSGAASSAQLAKVPVVREQEMIAAPASAPAAVASADSLSRDSLVRINRPLGNINTEGVVPVNLGNE